MICALCRHEKGDLIDSHLIPSAAYRHIKGVGEYLGLSPIKIDGFKLTAAHSDRQITMFLLCSLCEDLLSRNGEKFMGNLWATSEGFPFLACLKDIQPVVKTDIYTGYDASKLDQSLVKALIYFAASIFWRAQVWDWGYAGDPYKHALGEKYEELFRGFLLGENALDGVNFIVEVNSDAKTNAMISLPVFSRHEGEISHVFTILGFRFNMYVGGTINKDLLKAFKSMGTNIIIYTLDFRKSPAYSRLAGRVQKDVVTKGKLAKRIV